VRALAVAITIAACAHRGGGVVTAPDASPSGTPQLGAHWTADGSAIDFRVASTRATRVELDVYDAPLGAAPRVTIAMTFDGAAWAARVDAAALAGFPAVYYGYRAWGPNWPYDASWQPGSLAGFVADVDADGNRMNPNKLLFDPYARELSHDPISPPQPDGSYFATGAHRAVDSGPVAPKSIVLRDDPPDAGARPTRALADDILYEVHVRGFTMSAGACAGTYAAAGARATALAQLGITAIELLPIFESSNDRDDIDPTTVAGDNYWGYSTLAYFAPDRRYACDRSPGGPTREVRAMVRAFHAAGVKVILDVVYNHTAEGGGGSLLSLRGLDNAGYYQLDRAGTGFTNDNGVGADVAAQKPLARALIVDSLHYWVDAIGVDGFRFDLAPVLGNSCGAGCFTFDPSALPQQLATEFAGVALIAEPWAVVAGGYAVGKFPPGWSEWNDRFRDTIREDQNENGKTPIAPGELAKRIAGSPDLYGARAPSASIDYISSHDGFTLHDEYACAAANNGQAFPFGPSSPNGAAEHSWDHGGDAAAQRQATRTGLALVALSAGVPMITGGDELGRSLRCNDNAFNVDSSASWLDWSQANQPLATFAARLFAFRAAHAELRPRAFDTYAWYDAGGAPASQAFLADATQPVLAWRAGDVYVAYDRGPSAVSATLPSPGAGLAWYRVADTAAWMEPEANFVAPGGEQRVPGASYGLASRSLAIFIAKP
jgi:glycogen operon protein